MPQNLQTNEKSLKAVILVDNFDFGRCPLASSMRTAQWPVADKSVLQRLIDSISLQGINQFVICCDSDSSDIKQSLNIPEYLNVRFIDEPLPRGPAGCVYDAAEFDKNELIFLFQANIIAPPDIHNIIKAHRKSNADMTIIFNPSYENNEASGQTTQIFICEHSVLDYIPKAGYCDIKESLVPDLIKNNKIVHALHLSSNAGNFQSWSEYLEVVSDFLYNSSHQDIIFHKYKRHGLEDVWIGSNVKIDSSSRITGPVVICDGVEISENVFVMGPSIIGKDVKIGKDSLIDNSIIWDNSYIGNKCQIKKSLIDYDSIIIFGKNVNKQLITYRNNIASKMHKKVISTMDLFLSNMYECIFNFKKTKTGQICSQKNLDKIALFFGAIIMLIVLIVTYWNPTISDLTKIWVQSDEYSCGLLVPFLTIYILWSRRHNLSKYKLKPTLWGIAAIIGAQVFRYMGLFLGLGSAERISLVFTTAALALLLCGWKLFFKLSPVLAYLLLMLPLPNRIQQGVTPQLQEWATRSAVYCLELLGYQVTQDGNIINLNGTLVAVAEACNGLRMLTAFFVISGLVALLIKRKWWEKAIIFMSSVPIALLCNTIRLAVTSIAFTMLNSAEYEKVFHDFGGLAMMPIALIFIVFELWLLSNIFTEADESQNKKQIIYKKNKTKSLFSSIQEK